MLNFNNSIEHNCRWETSVCTKYTVFQKSDAKIQITITTAYLIRIKYPLSSFDYHLFDVNVQISTKSTTQFVSNSCFKNWTQKQKYPIWKSRLSSSYTKTSVTFCAQSGRRLHGVRTHARSRTRHFELLGHDVLVEATSLLDETLFQVVDVAIPAIVDALLEHAPHTS